MQVARPPIVRVRISGTGEVVDERVEPHVDALTFVAGDWNAPLHAGSGNGNVRHEITDVREHLVAPRLRTDELRMLSDMLQENIAIFRQTEKIIFLLDRFRSGLVQRALPLDEIRLRVKRLAPLAIQPLVRALVDVAVRLDRLPKRPDRAPMRWLGRPNESDGR